MFYHLSQDTLRIWNINNSIWLIQDVKRRIKKNIFCFIQYTRYNETMATIHESILEYLNRKGKASVAELSLFCNVSRADIRYHLNQMVVGGMVEAFRTPTQSKRGRPANLYKLSPQFRPTNYQNLARIALQLLEREDPPVEAMASLILKDMQSQGSKTHLLNALIKMLNSQNYQASWEAYSQGPRIHFKNCPYAGLVPQYSFLCTLDTSIISTCLKELFRQTAKNESAGGSDPGCSFLPATVVLKF
jgi:predicted ArsR family transcriptional regulator